MNPDIDITGTVLAAERLTLRPWRIDDLEDFFAYARVDEVGRMAGWLPHRSIDESREILEMFIREKKTFAVEYLGRAIGSVGIEPYDESAFCELDGLRGREIGYALSKDYWGLGLMPEAVKAVIRYLFDVAGLDFLLAGHFVRNHRSARVIAKCGFRRIRNIQYRTHCGSVEESLVYILCNPRLQEAEAWIKRPCDGPSGQKKAP